jgi:hypothetical protein
MTTAVRGVIIVAVLALLAVGLFVARQSMGLAPRQATVIRRPNTAAPQRQVKRDMGVVLQNLAPFATVSVSSTLETVGKSSEGVADGVLDGREWVTQGETGGAWIKLTWDNPPTIEEVDLYDRPNGDEHVLNGSLSFEDGSVIYVPPLPANGQVWRAVFPPKKVHWVMFRIDQAQGTNTGLAEIMVLGTPNPGS